MTKDCDIHQVNTKQRLQSLLASIKNGEEFADKFHFKTETLRTEFLKETIPSEIDFEKEYYFFDEKRNIHIAESEDDFFG